MYTGFHIVATIFFTLAGLAVIGMVVVSLDKVAQKLNKKVNGGNK